MITSKFDQSLVPSLIKGEDCTLKYKWPTSIPRVWLDFNRSVLGQVESSLTTLPKRAF